MPRDINNTAETELQNQEVNVAFFATFGNNLDVKLWSGIGDKTHNSVTYTGAGKLLKFGQITEEVGLSSTTFSVSLTGLDPSMNSVLLNEDMQGQDADIYLAVLDDNGDIVGDLITLFSGSIDTVVLNVTAEESTLAITIAHELARFDKARPRFESDSKQQTDHPGDLILSRLTETVGKEFVFGPS